LEFNSVSDPGTTITIATVVEGVHPVWGDFFLSFRGQKTGPISHDATASEMEAELEKLSTIGEITATAADYGRDVFNRAIQRIWTVRFDQHRYAVKGGDPTNVGPLPLFSADDSTLKSTREGRQRAPTVYVNRILLGSTGNAREDNKDINNVTVLLTHTQRTDHKISMFEVQEMTCTASAGTFTLSFVCSACDHGVQKNTTYLVGCNSQRLDGRARTHECYF
jgi:hypothetical protein